MVSTAIGAPIPPAKLALPLAGSFAISHRLFTIVRNKNANLMCYDANLNGLGKFDRTTPVVAYWEMLAEDGHREDMNGFEARHAYGFSVEHLGDPNTITLRIKALESRPILILSNGGIPHAEIEISGKLALLEHVFVEAGGGLFPSVDYIQLFGSDLKTHRKVSEQFKP